MEAATEIKFRRDTSFRKAVFSPDSFAHPAKMDAQLLLWIVDRYTKSGDTILDPMAGSGTAMLGCTIGRNVIQVELEKKFVDMQEASWQKVRMMPQLGHEIGECQIIQGDARQLGDILADAAIFSPPYGNRLSDEVVDDGDPQRMSYRQALDSIITSPPYAEGLQGKDKGWEKLAQDPTSNRYGRRSHQSVGKEYSDNPENIGNLPYGDVDSIITSPPYEASVSDNKEGPLAGGNKENYGRWREGTARKTSYTQHGEPVDSIITSPPYEGSDISQTHMTSNKRGDPSNPNYRPSWTRKLADGYAQSKRPYHEVDSIVTSPPYSEGLQGKASIESKRDKLRSLGYTRQTHGFLRSTQSSSMGAGYSEDNDNIGNLKGGTYLSAMLQVYQQCHKVLKAGGLMVVVTKNFIRDKKEVRLDEDTIRLCEQAGFRLMERHYRKLPAQSFWRTIYQQKYPDAPVLDKEDVLVFQKA